ncbi:MAG: adenosylhomocysteinase [Actinomycetota bacterium]
MAARSVPPTPAGRSRIADETLAPDGNLAIDWAARHSPVVDGHVREVLSDGALAGRRVAVVVHLEAKTAFLATVLADAGAEVVVAGSNPHSTRDDVAAALVDRGLEVHSTRNSGYEAWEKDLLAVADTGPEFIVDDGAELTVRMLRHRPDRFAALRGVTEQTTTGVARLRAIDAAGRLPFPTIAANDARCKHLFDNRYGTGQSTIQAILNLTNMLLPGKVVVIVGYGWVGNGLATYVRAMAGHPVVVEVDPVRALEARMDGHDVAPIAQALPRADFVITATGGVRALGQDHFPLLKDGAILANAGHHDLEIDVESLDRGSTAHRVVRAGIERFTWNGERDIHLLASGALVNIAGGLGHPIEIMDLSFAVQGLGCHRLAATDLQPGVHLLPDELDRAIAAAKLAADGISLDSIADDQRDTVDDWLPPSDGD